MTRKGDEIPEHSLYYTGWLKGGYIYLNDISYGIPSGPGEDFKFALFSIFFTSFGRKGSQLNGLKFGDSWAIDKKGNQFKLFNVVFSPQTHSFAIIVLSIT